MAASLSIVRMRILRTLEIIDKRDARIAEFLVRSQANSEVKTILGCILVVHWVKYWIYDRKTVKRIIIMREFATELKLMVRKMQKKIFFESE